MTLHVTKYILELRVFIFTMIGCKTPPSIATNNFAYFTADTRTHPPHTPMKRTQGDKGESWAPSVAAEMLSKSIIRFAYTKHIQFLCKTSGNKKHLRIYQPTNQWTSEIAHLRKCTYIECTSLSLKYTYL